MREKEHECYKMCFFLLTVGETIAVGSDFLRLQGVIENPKPNQNSLVGR
jgi:hypothetical protein